MREPQRLCQDGVELDLDQQLWIDERADLHHGGRWGVLGEDPDSTKGVRGRGIGAGLGHAPSLAAALALHQLGERATDDFVERRTFAGIVEHGLKGLLDRFGLPAQRDQHGLGFVCEGLVTLGGCGGRVRIRVGFTECNALTLKLIAQGQYDLLGRALTDSWGLGQRLGVTFGDARDQLGKRKPA